MAGGDISKGSTTSRYVQLRELLLGIEGLAILRGLVDATPEEQQARLDEIRRICSEFDEEPWSIGMDVGELDARNGYAAWSATYDSNTNPLIAAEQPIVEALVADVAPGKALDAACGTGRHSKHLSTQHDVVGVDASPEMLAVARGSVPDATFVEGDFRKLDFDDGSFDLVVCSLALTHIRELTEPIREFARVTKLGGRVVCSDIHPMNVIILGQAFFSDESGNMSFVRNHIHPVSSYIDAFNDAGLRVRRCIEPLADGNAVRMAMAFVPEATIQAISGLPFAIVWDLERV